MIKGRTQDGTGTTQGQAGPVRQKLAFTGEAGCRIKEGLERGNDGMGNEDEKE